MKNKIFMITLCLTLVLSTLCGCSYINKKAAQYSKVGENCSINREDVTKISYKGKEYTILEETQEKGKLGRLVGYIRKLACIDNNGKVLSEENSNDNSVKTLTDIKAKTPDAAYIIPFLNVYQPKGESFLYVDVNGGFHKAIKSGDVKSSDKIFNFKKTSSDTTEEFKINPKNCTELLRGEKVYKISDNKLNESQVGEYVDILAKSICFNKDTKTEIPKDELTKIDPDGKGISKDKRESWTLGEIHKVNGKDTNDCVAVEINNEFYKATAK